MEVPSYQDLMYYVLNEMRGEKSYKRKDLYTKIEPLAVIEYKTSIKENTIMQNGLTKICDRICWAMTFLTKAEYIEKDLEKKFHYKITDLGKIALEDIKKNNKILNEKYLKENSPNYASNWQVKMEKINDSCETQNKNDENDENINEELNLQDAIDKIIEKVEDEFTAEIKIMPWQNFENFCVGLVVKMGYGIGKNNTIKQRDGGIDGEILADELGLRKIYIQAKRYESGNVSMKDMKEFLYTINSKNTTGIFITTSSFSQDAKDIAKNHVGQPISLIDINLLVKLCMKYEHGIIKVKYQVPELNFIKFTS